MRDTAVTQAVVGADIGLLKSETFSIRDGNYQFLFKNIFIGVLWKNQLIEACVSLRQVVLTVTHPRNL